jgi:alkylation response protein AidB-like acyl-CoA dehydrogenase
LNLLSAELEEIATRVRRLARERVAPRAAEIDSAAEFPWDVVAALREERVFGLPFPREYGGSGSGPFALLIAIEELAKVCATTALTLSMQQLGSLPIKLAGSGEQKRRWLPPLASGEWLPAYALTERNAGSDPAALATEARRDGTDYVLNGDKCFISNAGVAMLYTVFAKTDPSAGHRGITAVVVEDGRPGFTVGRVLPKMGLRGQPTGDLTFRDCRVPVANRLGAEGEGFRLAMRVLDRSRPGIAAQALGIAAGATEYARGWAIERRTFGKPIIEHQQVAALLADMETRCAGARALLYECGRVLEGGGDDGALTKIAAIAKLFCSEVAMQVTTDAVQILGGYGYVADYPLERLMRDAKVTQIYEGTNQIQRLVIAREMAKEAPLSPPDAG